MIRSELASLAVGYVPESMSVPKDRLDELLTRAAIGDEAAFAALYDATARRVFGLALKILGSHDAAEEATLAAYTYIWRHASRFDPQKGSVVAWILTIGRSRALDVLRSRVRQRDRERSLGAASEISDVAPDPEALGIGSQEGRRIRQALESLPAEQREAIEAAYFAGLTHSEIADRFGQPLGTVKTRIRLGLLSLRQILATFH